MKAIIKYLLTIYRKFKVSGYNCRYHPSCSRYAEDAIDQYGVLKGIYLTLKRIIKCNQLFPGGYDPVP